MAFSISSDTGIQQTVNITEASGTTDAFSLPSASGSIITVVVSGTFNGASVTVQLGADGFDRYEDADNGSFSAAASRTLRCGAATKAKIDWSGGDGSTDLDIDFIA
jgi:hypothetical protein